MFGPKFKKFFNTPLPTYKFPASVKRALSIIDKILVSLVMLAILVLFGWIITILPKYFHSFGYSGDTISMSVILICSPMVMCIIGLGELIPQYKLGARKISRWLALFCVLMIIANKITQHV
jgi:TRAP-type C4-dicarboxylate transport system permease small subunit